MGSIPVRVTITLCYKVTIAGSAFAHVFLTENVAGEPAPIVLLFRVSIKKEVRKNAHIKGFCVLSLSDTTAREPESSSLTFSKGKASWC